ncbi:TonB-dependent receptor [Sphingomonas bacterium]|uniref:TonB-dependent receptor n=1 Tax=Sphingomonas bacterium TaxID=1895847 RepID=UPI0015772C3B|nr:TonB-dependent receptor [Sphingomonas bacterium]
MGRLKTSHLLAGVCFLSATPVVALAQEVPDSASTNTGNASATASNSQADTGNDIVVTATKRATSIQNTPIAITAFTENRLRSTGTLGLTDLARLAPGLNVTEQESGRYRVSIRSIQTSGESTVGVYYGETPLTGPSGTTSDPSSATPNINLFDVERVEVLRGPQGTLYGSGSMGGTLRVLFNQPDATKIGGTAEGEFTEIKNGSTGYAVRGAINLPLVTDKLAVRLAGYSERSGGYVDNITLKRNDLNRADNSSVRGTLAFTPSDSFSLSALALYQKLTIDGSSNYRASLGAYISDRAVGQPYDSKLQLYSLTGNLDLGFAKLTGVTSYYRWDVNRTEDNSQTYGLTVSRGTYCPLFTGVTTCNAAQLAAYRAYGLAQQPVGARQPSFVHNWTNELRLASAGTSPFNWTAGVFHEDRRDEVHTLVFAGDAATGGPRSPITDLGSRYVITTVRQLAFFGEASYKLFHMLTLTAGARHYDYNKVVGSEYLAVNYFNGQIQRPYRAVGVKASGWVKKFSADVAPTKGILLYVSAAQGFRPGGANNVPGLSDDLITYKADSLWNYETGIKTDWLAHRLTLNVAAYRIDWKNLQTSVLALNNNSRFIGNIGAARIQGIEIEASANPFAGLTLSGSANFVSAKLTENQISSVSTAAGLDGDFLTYIPRHTFSATADYKVPIIEDWSGFLHADYSYTGRENSELRPNSVIYRTLGDYSLVNFRFGVDRNNLTIAAFVSNVFNKNGITYVNAISGLPDYLVGTRPRTIGLNIRQAF